MRRIERFDGGMNVILIWEYGDVLLAERSTDGRVDYKRVAPLACVRANGGFQFWR
jgi:hypothetical protein